MVFLTLEQMQLPSKSALSVLFLLVFLDNLGFAIVLPYLFFYAENLGATTLTYGVLLAAYSLMSFIFTPIVARLSDRYGRRKILLYALAVATFAYFLFGVSNSLLVLFVSRMLSGTTAATVPVAQAYVADLTTHNTRLKYLGLLGAAAGIAFILGPALGGIISAFLGYGVPSFLASALAFANLVSAYFLLPEPARFSDKNQKRPVLSFRALLKIIQKREMTLLLSIYFMFFVAFVFLQTTLSPWLQTVYGFGALQTGLIFFFIGGVSVFTQGIVLPKLSQRHSRLFLTLVGSVVLAGGMLALAPTRNIELTIAIAGVIAFGFGTQFVTLNTLISLRAPTEAQGGTLGIAWAIAGVAQAVTPVLAAGTFSLGVSLGIVGLTFAISAVISVATIPMLLSYKKAEEISKT